PERNYRTEDYGDFIFSPARLTPLKRVSLLIEAIAQVPNARAVISGEGTELTSIMDAIRQNHLESRVELVRHRSDEEMAQYYARCRAVFYAPRDEDYDLVTLELFGRHIPSSRQP